MKKKKKELNLNYKQNKELLLLLNKKFKVDPTILVIIVGNRNIFWETYW